MVRDAVLLFVCVLCVLYTADGGQWTRAHMDTTPQNDSMKLGEAAGEGVVDEEAVDEEAAGEEVVDEEAAGEEVVIEEAVDEEAVDEEAVDEKAVDEEAVDEEAVDEEAAGEEVVVEEVVVEEAVDEEAVDEKAAGEGVVDEEAVDEEEEAAGEEVVVEEAVDEEAVDEEAAGEEVVIEEAVDEEAVDEEAAGEEVVVEEAVDEEAADEEAVDEKAAGEEVVDEEAAGEEVVIEEAVDEEAVDEEAAGEEVVDEEAVDEEAVDEEAVDEEAAGEEVVVEEAVDEEAVDEEAVDEEAAGEEVVVEEAVDEEAVDEKAAGEEVVDEEAAGEEVVIEEAVDEEAVDEEAVDEEAAGEEVVVEEAVDEEAVDEEAVDEEAAGEEVVVEEAVDEEAVDEKAAGEEAVDEKAVDEEAVNKKPVNEKPVDEKAKDNVDRACNRKTRTTPLHFVQPIIRNQPQFQGRRIKQGPTEEYVPPSTFALPRHKQGMSSMFRSSSPRFHERKSSPTPDFTLDPKSSFNGDGRPSSAFRSSSGRFQRPSETPGPGTYVAKTDTFRVERRPVQRNQPRAHERCNFFEGKKIADVKGPGLFTAPSDFDRAAQKSDRGFLVRSKSERFEPVKPRGPFGGGDYNIATSNFSQEKKSHSTMGAPSQGERLVFDASMTPGPGHVNTPRSSFDVSKQDRSGSLPSRRGMVRTTRKCLGEDVQLYTASSEDVWFGWGSAVWAVVILVSHVARWRTVFWAVVPPFVVYVVVRFFTAVKAESLLVVQELGVQLKTTFFNGRERYTFIDRERIQAIVLNEGFRLDAVLFYLAFVVRGSPRLILAFETLFPRLEPLAKIYRGAKEMMFPSG